MFPICFSANRGENTFRLIQWVKVIGAGTSSAVDDRKGTCPRKPTLPVVPSSAERRLVSNCRSQLKKGISDMPEGTHNTENRFSATGSGKEIVVINGVRLSPIETSGQRVVTLAMIDKVHGRLAGTARKRLNDNRERFLEGKHYFVRNSDEARAIGITAPNGLTVLTERGYLMLVKSMNDDVAWKVQDALVESYFVKTPTAAAPRPRAPRIDVAREHRLTLALLRSFARDAGLKGNQAVLAANRGAEALTGVNTLGLMGAIHLDAPQQEALLSPTDIGQQFGLGSGQAVNNLMIAVGWQNAGRVHQGKAYYEPTEEGIRNGAVLQDTGKCHSNGVPVRQLRWASSAGRALQEIMAAGMLV